MEDGSATVAPSIKQPRPTTGTSMDDSSRKQGYSNDIGNAWLNELQIRFFANFARNW